MPDRDFLRATFTSVAREYDAMRPGYPEALIEDAIALSGLPVGGRCLEIGCGTGQASRPFARRGCQVLCLDIGAEMLAIIYNMHPRPSEGFFIESQPLYQQYDPAWREPPTRPVEDEIQAHVAEIDATGLFEPVITRTYPWRYTCSTVDYLRLINTYSGHLALPEANRRALYAGLADLIDRRYGGQVVKDYLAVLYLARKPGARAGAG